MRAGWTCDEYNLFENMFCWRAYYFGYNLKEAVKHFNLPQPLEPFISVVFRSELKIDELLQLLTPPIAALFEGYLLIEFIAK